MGRGVRKTRKEIVLKEIVEVDSKISTLTEKIAVYKKQREELQNELKQIEEDEARMAEEKRNIEILEFIKKNNITKEQLESFIAANTSES